MEEYLKVGETYERDLINVLFGIPAECECRIVAFDENGEHHCSDVG